MFSGQIVLIAGAPCSGKGTQCKMLEKKTGMVHISAGDLCREKSTCNDGVQVKSFIDAKELVPDELFVTLLKERMSKPDAQANGVLLDGFPRTPSQVHYLMNGIKLKKKNKKKKIKIGGMVLLQVEDEILKSRAKDRRVDPVTGNIFNLSFNPCLDTEVASRLIPRKHDDDPVAFNQRIVAWNKYFIHVDAELTKSGVSKVEVNGNGTIDEVNHLVTEALSSLSKPKPPNANQSQGVGVSVLPPPPPVVAAAAAAADDDGGWGETDGGGWGSDSVNEEGGVSMDDPIIKITPCSTIDTASSQWLIPSNVNVCVSIDVPDLLPGSERPPCDIVCVVDISGSMNSPAAIERPDGTFDNSNGLTVLGLVLHSIKSVMHMVGDQDRVAIVTFNGKAERVLELTHMTEEGRTTATEALYNIRATGKTNVWDGVYQGMQVLRGVDAPEPEPEAPLSAELTNLVRLGELTLDQAKTMANFDRDQGETGGAAASGGGGKKNDGNSKSLNNNRSKTMLLLTDGQPNIVPPRGILAEIKDYKDTNDFEFQINTFGFGYDLKSNMLGEIAEECNGTFAFIPDAVIVGTTFVDCVSNVLNTKAQQATVNLVLKNGAKFGGSSLGNHLHETDETWGKQVALGPLQVMQRRTLVVPIVLPASSGDGSGGGGGGGSSLSAGSSGNDEMLPYLEASLSFRLSNGTSKTVQCIGNKRLFSYEAVLSEARANTVKDGIAALNYGVAGGPQNGPLAVQCVKARADVLKSLVEQWSAVTASTPNEINLSTFQALATLSADVNGRMSKALNGAARFNRWGKHYLRALIRAHQVELCTNFMDPGVQSYGAQSEHFKSYRAAGDQIFLKLPMVKPTENTPPTPQPPRNNNNQGNNPAAAAPPPRPPSPVDNSQYYCSGGGCIGGSNTIAVVIMDGDNDDNEKKDVVYEFKGYRVVFKQAHEVKSKDHVLVLKHDNRKEIMITQVKCVVKTILSKEKKMFSFPKQGPLAGLEITSGHPILINGEWNKPRQFQYSEDVKLKRGEIDVYNFVLNQGHQLIVNLDVSLTNKKVEVFTKVDVNDEIDHESLVVVATLGHGIKNNSVVSHPYLGNMQLIEQDLSNIKGWDDGEVTVNHVCRDIATNMITAMF